MVQLIQYFGIMKFQKNVHYMCIALISIDSEDG